MVNECKKIGNGIGASRWFVILIIFQKFSLRPFKSDPHKLGSKLHCGIKIFLVEISIYFWIEQPIFFFGSTANWMNRYITLVLCLAPHPTVNAEIPMPPLFQLHKLINHYRFYVSANFDKNAFFKWKFFDINICYYLFNLLSNSIIKTRLNTVHWSMYTICSKFCLLVKLTKLILISCNSGFFNLRLPGFGWQ
jgi:hypothetical protein